MNDPKSELFRPTDPFEQIIWSADVADEMDLMHILDQMPQLRVIKIDRLFVTDSGLSVISRLTERGLLVFDDAKLIEIPSKLEALANKHLRYRPFMLNCMAGSVSSGIYESEKVDEIDGLKRFADACHEVGTKPCGVTVLTSKKPGVVREEFNSRTHVDQVLYYVEQLLNCGFTDVVCSPQELQAIRAEHRFDSLSLNTPGIRPAGAAQDDQARSDTPKWAIDAGATRLVIGRPITNGDPAENLANIAASIAAAA